MAATYKQFLAAPSSSLLADTAALYYVTTTTTFAGPTQIIKHLNGLQKQVSKKKEEVFNIVDGGNVIVLEIDTGLGFQSGGGPYLPGLDDNFLSARDVYLPITHFVSFDEAGKIVQIRLQWDQGSLLKQVEVIGKSGRNWPIRDSREQIAFIQSCIRTAGTAAPAAPSHNETVARDRTNSKNALRDPYASLRLFGPRDEIEDAEPATVVSPYAGTRPRQRSFTEILGDEPTSPSAGRRAMSPSKGGQGKNFQPSRIFDGQEDVDRPPLELQQHTKKRYIKPHPKKYSHFEFADGSDPQDSPQKGQHFDDLPKTKRDSQWSFEDFTTPQKVKPSKTMRTQDVRHWDTDRDATEDTPVYQAAKPRRDADPHFELSDDGERVPQAPRASAQLPGYAHNEGLGLYKNQVSDREEAGKNELPLGNITNVKERGKDFDNHFEIADNSPAHPQQRANEGGHKKAVQMMDRHWDTYDKSPATQKENRPIENTASHKINIAGDGMGGRKGTNRDWLYGETEDVAQPIPTRKQPNVVASGVPLNKSAKISIAGDGMGGRKGTDRDWLYNEASETANDESTNTRPIPGRTPASNTAPTNEVKENTDKHKINIAGDGMGGRKGTNRDWLYGETDELASTVSTNTKPVPGRTPASNTAPANEVKENTDKHKINIAGDGMGGRKGANRDWLYGDVSDVNEKPLPSRRQNTSSKKDDFWDF
ncbi:hypothetical protein FLAG1_05503 [Fusarium langsethiae]|uniref:Uncharacterized protein n=1 Tax=Fusarium langsethiae TaxID=179993 RepID=A0A0N0DET9_FUSLA|nr:hypothetical protein FLAG1_05503 [Fusarium langsethiae]GKT98801.1 unnamed protein product [Fusarium langsethiae]GKU10364.1 unnamed protein product [Fusarium langsethiae]